MNLEPLRASLHSAADAESDRLRAATEAAGAQRLDEARTQAQAIVDQARRDGEQAAARAAARVRAAASRRARELRLHAKGALVDELRARAYNEAPELRMDPRYPELLERLSRMARTQLGPAADLELDPRHVGGLLARVGGVSVDYSLPALVDRAIDALDDHLEGLWQ